MKFCATATSLILLPLSTLASPVAEPAVVAVSEDLQAREEIPIKVSSTSAENNKEQSKAELVGRDLFARNVMQCRIINAKGYADCRSGPDGSYPVTYHALRGVRYSFNCSKLGSCVGGDCEWHRLFWNGGYCWVSGYYTESQCSVSTLGECD